MTFLCSHDYAKSAPLAYCQWYGPSTSSDAHESGTCMLASIVLELWLCQLCIFSSFITYIVWIIWWRTSVGIYMNISLYVYGIVWAPTLWIINRFFLINECVRVFGRCKYKNALRLTCMPVCVIYAASLIGVLHGVFIPTCLCLSPLLMVFWWIHGISVLNVVTVQTNA